MTIDLSEVLADARGELVRHGDFPARIIVETDESKTLGVILMDVPSDSDQRRALMFLLGFELAGGSPERVGTLRRPHSPVDVAFVSEAWYVEGAQTLDVMPSRHPQRREALVAARMSAPPSKAEMEIAPFVRTRQGIRFTLQPDVPADAEPQALLLEMFWSGVAMSVHADDPEVKLLVLAAQVAAGGIARFVNLEDLDL